MFDGVGINLEVSVVDLSTGEVGPAKPMRGEEGWTVEELKQHIGEVRRANYFMLLFTCTCAFNFFLSLFFGGIVFKKYI